MSCLRVSLRLEHFSLKKLIVVLLVTFLGFWMVSDPHGLAVTAQAGGSQLWGLTADLFSSLIAFLRELA